jgi:uncharacterized protein (TIGR02099 family)
VTIHWSRIGKRLWYIAAIIIIVAALLVSAGRLVTPYINNHIPDVESWISRAIKLPVTVSKAYFSWDVYQPVLSFDGVKILEPDSSKPRFQVENISVSLDVFHSLLARKFVIGTIKMSGALITIQQNAAGEMNIQGFQVSDNRTGSSTTAEEVMEWVFSIPNLVLQNINVNFQPNKNPELLFILNRLVLKNENNQHLLFGRAVLNQQIPTHITTRFIWEGNIADVSHITASAYIYLEGLSLSQWLEKNTWHDLSVKQGLGSAKFWIDWKDNAWQKIQTSLQFYGIELKSQKTLKSILIPRINGNFGWRRESHNQQVYAGDQIFIDLPDHLWPETAFSVSLDPDVNGNLLPTLLHAKYIDVQDVKNMLINAGILPEGLAKQIVSINPKGEIQDIQAKIQNATYDPEHIQLTTSFNGLSIDPFENYPGMTNVTGAMSWDGNAGILRLDSENAAIYLNQVFLNAIPFGKLTGSITLAHEDNGSWLLQTHDLIAVNLDAKAHANLKLLLPLDQSPQIDLTADFQVMNAKHISNYLPLKIYDPDVVTWLRNAFGGGRVVAGKAVLQGLLSDFPFDNHKGIFSISGEVRNTDLNFAPGWPVLHNLAGKLTFVGRSMMVAIDSGTLLNIPIGAVHAEIPYFGDDQPQILQVQGDITSDFTKALSFVHNSPLQKTIGEELGAMDIKGPMQLKLNLTIPLRNPEQTKVQGEVTTPDAKIILPDWKLSLEKLHGMFHFTESDVNASQMQGFLLGENAILDIATQHPQNQTSFVQVNLQTQLSTTGLQSWLKIPLSSLAQGKTALTAELHLYSHDQSSKATTATIRSNLVGVSLNLPESLGKKAEDARDLQIDLTKQNQQLRAKINYNNLLSAALQFNTTPQGLRFFNGEINLGGQANWQSQSGLVLSGAFKQLDWDVLQQRMTGKTIIDVSYLRKIHLDVGVFTAFGQQLNQVRADIAKPNNTWIVDLNSDEMNGQLMIPAGNTQQPIVGKFQRVTLKSVSSGKKSAADPRKIPPLNITANNVRYGDKNLGAVTISTARMNSGLSIRDLRIESSLVKLRAQGEWQKNTGGRDISHLNGAISTAHLSDLLKSWGYGTSNFVGSKGDITFDLTWQGAPFSPSVNGLSGRMSLSLGPGRIVNLSDSNNAKMDLGRLLNVFSLSSIPQRLSLDFSDVFEKGYGFYYAKGDFALKNGNAFTDKIRIDGPIAGVSISGRIGLAAQDLDLIMSVTPYVTSSLPIVATVATGLNPLAGVATWMLDKVVGKAVSKAATYHYAVKGLWVNPTWSQIKQGKQ